MPYALCMEIHAALHRSVTPRSPRTAQLFDCGRRGKHYTVTTTGIFRNRNWLQQMLYVPKSAFKQFVKKYPNSRSPRL